MSTWLSRSEVSEIFAEEIASGGGSVSDCIQFGGKLFARAVLPPNTEVFPGDKLKGGVALRATETDIFVHPYVFRVVCSNGAIMARATQTRHISMENWFVDSQAEGDLESTVRGAIAGCCRNEAFFAAADQMRTAREFAADMAVTMAAMASTHRLPATVLTEILRRYDQAADRTGYGLMNAVTSVARDQRDSQLQWRLEELGGSIPALLRRPKPSRGKARAVGAMAEVG